MGALLALRADARGALRHVGWTDADIAAKAASRLVKLVVFCAPAAPPASWDEVFAAALPAAAAARGPGWCAEPATNDRFVRLLQQHRAEVQGAAAASHEWDADRRVDVFLAGYDAGAPNWAYARRLLALVLWLDDLFDGTGRTRKPDGSAGCAEYLVASSVPEDEGAAVLEFSVA